MIEGIGQAISDMMFWLVLIAFAAGFAVATFVWIGVPWLWEIVRPWVHQITA
jgi:hypothetical protein